MALSLQRRSLANDACAIGHQQLVGLLKLDSEQTIEGVFEIDFALAAALSHVGGHGAHSP
jgi:hypothetical protein